MKKRILSLLLCLCMVVSLLPFSASAETMTKRDIPDTVNWSKEPLTHLKYGGPMIFDMLIPENGVGLLIFYSSYCGYSQKTLKALNNCDWLDNPYLDITAVECNRNNTASVVQNCLDEHAPNAAQYMSVFYHSDYNVNLCWDYLKLISNDYSFKYPMVAVITKDGDGRTLHFMDERVTDPKLMYKALCETCPAFAKYEEDNHVHKLTKRREVAVSCDMDGQKAHYTCECGKHFLDAEGTQEVADLSALVIPAPGHKYTDASDKDCDVCGYAEGKRPAGFTEFEWEVLRLTSRERLKEDLKPLTGTRKLQEATNIRAVELHSLFSHTRPDGTDCYTVFDEADVPYSRAAENIALGSPTPEEVVAGWMNSPGHRANILTPELGHMGVGEDNKRWVQLFTDAPDYTQLTVYPAATTCTAGTEIAKMDLYGVLQNSAGESYLPLEDSYCSGYDPTKLGTQTVTVNVFGLSATFTVTVEEAPHVHTWVEATCSAPKTCSECKETEGEPLPHTWVEATCAAPKTCSVCKATEGDALPHAWVEATCTVPKTCSVCKATEGEAKGHTWVEASGTNPKMCLVCKVTEVTQNTEVDKDSYYGRNALKQMPNAEALLYAYDQIVAGVEATADKIQVYDGVHPISPEEVSMVFRQAYRNDYAQHFWLDNGYGVTYTGGIITHVNPEYLLTGDALTAAKKEFEAAANEILTGITSPMTDYEKELYIHDALAARIDYVKGSTHAHNAYGALVEGKSVCEGYAEAFQYLLHRVGIQSFIVTGNKYSPTTGAGEAHEWNVVKIDGQWYQVDLTWDDQGKHLFHMYFNQTDAVMNNSHVYDKSDVPRPVCTSDAAFYFTGNDGNFLVSGYSVDAFAKVMKRSNYSGHFYVGDTDRFENWLVENIAQIIEKMGIPSTFGLEFASLENESIIVFKDMPACEHQWEAATCKAPRTCKLCGAQTGVKAEHAWHIETVKTCMVCGKTEGEPVQHDHVYDRALVADVYKATDATCVAKATYYKSCNCGGKGTETFEAGELAGHSWVNATCTAPKTCSVCQTTEGEPVAHTWVDATETTPKTCSVCQATEGEPLPHTHVFDQTIAEDTYKATDATCTTKATYCKSCKCGEKGTETFEAGELAEHTWMEATCTTAKTCSVCKVKEGKPAGHKEEVLEGRAPSCAQTGLSQGSKCSVCGFVILEQIELLRLPHTWVDATCTAPKTCSVCKATEGDALPHHWEDATCTAPKTCKDCGETTGEALAHSFDNGKCTFCGAVDESHVTADVWGDANGDGKVNAKDAMLVLQYYTKKITEDKLSTAMSDVDGNGKLNAKDAMLVLQFYTKKIDTFPTQGKEPEAKPQVQVTEVFSDVVDFGDMKGCYHIPQITVNGNSNLEINRELQEILYGVLEEYVYIYEGEGGPDLCTGIQYTWNVKGDQLCLLVEVDWQMWANHYLVYVSAETGEVTDEEKLLSACGLTAEEFYGKVKSALEAYWEQNPEGWDFGNLEIQGQGESYWKNKTLSKENIENSLPYINPKGELCIATLIHVPVQTTEFPRLISLNGDLEGGYPNCGCGLVPEVGVLEDGVHLAKIYRGGTFFDNGIAYEKLGILEYEEYPDADVQALKVGDTVQFQDHEFVIENMELIESANGKTLYFNHAMYSLRYVAETNTWRVTWPGMDKNTVAKTILHRVSPNVTYYDYMTDALTGKNVYGETSGESEDYYGLRYLTDYFYTDRNLNLESEYADVTVKDGKIVKIEILAIL